MLDSPMISVRRPEPAKSAAPCAKPVSHGALQPLRAATAGGGAAYCTECFRPRTDVRAVRKIGRMMRKVWFFGKYSYFCKGKHVFGI